MSILLDPHLSSYISEKYPYASPVRDYCIEDGMLTHWDEQKLGAFDGDQLSIESLTWYRADAIAALRSLENETVNKNWTLVDEGVNEVIVRQQANPDDENHRGVLMSELVERQAASVGRTKEEFEDESLAGRGQWLEYAGDLRELRLVAEQKIKHAQNGEEIQAELSAGIKAMKAL